MIVTITMNTYVEVTTDGKVPTLLARCYKDGGGIAIIESDEADISENIEGEIEGYSGDVAGDKNCEHAEHLRGGDRRENYNAGDRKL